MQTQEKKDFKTVIKDFGEEGLMRTEQFTPNYLELVNISEDDVDGLIDIALDIDLEFYNAEVENYRYLPCHALQALGQMGVQKPLKDILERLEYWRDDDYYENAVMYYLRKIGSSDNIDVLLEYFLDKNRTISSRMVVLESIERIFKTNRPLPKDKIEKSLLTYLKDNDELDSFLNALVIFFLIDVSQDRHIELIREVFNTKPVDIFYNGDLEDIEIQLGLRKKRSKPREKSSLEIMIEKYASEAKLKPIISSKTKVGRNEPCPCGSGKKYKKCCLNK